MQMLNQITDPSKRVTRSAVKVIDYTKATVTKLYEEMLRIIKEENPEIVQLMLE